MIRIRFPGEEKILETETKIAPRCLLLHCDTVWEISCYQAVELLLLPVMRQGIYEMNIDVRERGGISKRMIVFPTQHCKI